MTEQHLEYYHPDTYAHFFDMKSSIEDHIKRGWNVKCISNRFYDNYTIVIYEREKEEPKQHKSPSII
jgi:hypothetical protein